MTRDEHNAQVQQLLGMIAPEHQADASEILTGLTEDYDETLTASETLTTENETLRSNNEKLRNVNAELFLKVGTTKKETQNHNQNNNTNNVPELSFDALFDEKGVLK